MSTLLKLSTLHRLMLIWSFQSFVPNFCSRIVGDNNLVVVLLCPLQSKLLQPSLRLRIKGKVSLRSKKAQVNLRTAPRRRTFSVITTTNMVIWRRIVVRVWLLNRRSKEGLSRKQMLSSILSRSLPFTPLWLRDLQIMWSPLPGTLIQVLHDTSPIDVIGSPISLLSVIQLFLEEVKSILLLARATFKFNLLGGISYSSMYTTFLAWNWTFSLSVRLCGTLLSWMWYLVYISVR